MNSIAQSCLSFHKFYKGLIRKIGFLIRLEFSLPADVFRVYISAVDVEISVGSTSPNCLTCVHCQRDWKKEARYAHMHKKQESCSIGLGSNPGIEAPTKNSLSFNLGQSRFTSTAESATLESRGKKQEEFGQLVVERELPIPEHKDIYHLTRENGASDMSSPEAVISCDEERLKLGKEAEPLA
ncbi:ABC transporter family protein [Striga asiatica]|uniref:ABC transporter family protein n=1 Tax=Striga asiatica TaxID=4170 RepID=A0A5A7RGS0_STRAF|nr:ABC transporter family protein [Striga asiatica]